MSNSESQLKPPTAGGPAALNAGSDGTSLRVLITTMALVIVPLIVLSQIIAFWRTDVVDDQMFAYYGWRIAHGAVPYLDVWDNKPPGIYWINALGMLLSGGSYFGILVLCGLALAVAHTAFFIGASVVYHRSSAALTTILLACYLTHAYYTGGANRTETFLVAFELTGVALYLHGFARGRWWKWYLAGVCCGTAFLFKQVGLAAWGCMGLHLFALALFHYLPWRTALGRAVLLLGGATTAIGAAVGVLTAQGALSAACYAVFGFNREYFAAGASEFPYSFVSWALLKEHIKPILVMPLLMAAAAVIHGFLWWWRPLFRPTDVLPAVAERQRRCPLSLGFFTAWTLVAWYGALMSPHAFRHYLVPTIPPLIFMAGYLIDMLRAEQRLLRRMQQRAWVTVAVVVVGYFAAGAVRTQFQEMSKVWVFRIDPWLTGTGQYAPAEWEAVGEAVREVTLPGDRIQCWGYLPGVYLTSKRVNAVRFTTTEKVGQVGAGARFVIDEIEQKLQADPPAALVMSATDYAFMTGRLPGKESDFKIGPWIEQHYTAVREVVRPGSFYILKRNDLVNESTPQIVIPR